MFICVTPGERCWGVNDFWGEGTWNNLEDETIKNVIKEKNIEVKLFINIDGFMLYMGSSVSHISYKTH